MGARGHDPRVDDLLCRRVGGQRGAADDRGRAENLGRRRAVAGQRLHALADRAGADRRRGRRPVRPAPHFRRRHRAVRRRVAVVRPLRRHRAAHRRPHPAGRGRRAADPLLARDHRRDLRRERTRRRDRHMGKLLGAVGGDRPVARRLDRRSCVVALDLPDQSVHRAAGNLHRAALRAGEPRRERPARARLARRASGIRRSRRAGLRSDCGTRARLERPVGDCVDCRRRRVAGAVRARRVTQPRADDAAGAVPLARLQRRERADPAALCGPRRRDVLPAVPAHSGERLLGDAGRRGLPAVHGNHGGAVALGRRLARPFRRAAAAHRRPRGRRSWGSLCSRCPEWRILISRCSRQ